MNPIKRKQMKARPDKKDWLSLPVHNLPTLKRYTREMLMDFKILFLGDVVRLCLNKKGEFVPINRRGFGVASNHAVARLLHRRGFLSEKALSKVQLPTYRFRKPTDEEIGEMKDVLVSKFPWSKQAQYLILHTANIGRRKTRGQWLYARRDQTDMVMGWEFITVGDLVRRFVRITSHGQTIFWITGHFGSRWYFQHKLSHALHECLPEIESFLVENYFLEKREEVEPVED